MNRETALARLCGDVSLLRDLAELFLADAPALLKEAESALARHDSATLERAAHSLKGLAANFDGVFVMAAARELEELARHKNLSEAGAVRDRLVHELGRLTSILDDLVQSDGRPA
jgi:HPt (histidine-containing phosphotransfer) domain-containing protein